MKKNKLFGIKPANINKVIELVFIFPEEAEIVYNYCKLIGINIDKTQYYAVLRIYENEYKRLLKIK